MVSARYARLSFCFALGSAFTASSNLRLAWDLFQFSNKAHYPRSIVILGELPTSA
jgi:hypothetical protein